MRVALVSLALLVFGCTQTQIRVFVDRSRDDEPPLEIEQLTLVVTPPRFEQTFDPPFPDFPLTFGIEPAGSPNAEVTIEATARVAGAAQPLTVRRRARFVEGDTFPVTLTFFRDCIGIDCQAGETCEMGTCVPDLVPCERGVFDCPDAGPDTLDASSDAGLAELACDLLDDDLDGRIDEGLDCPQRNPLALGHDHTCHRDGTTVRCWGLNHQGRLGDDGHTSTATRVAALGDWVDVAAGSDFTCAIDAAGDVHCWGANDRGQLGVSDPSVERARVTQIDGALDIAAGDEFACAIVADGRGVECWGRNDFDQLGPRDGDAGRVLGVSGAVQITAGARHACVVLDSGEARCWGHPADNRLGGSAPIAVPAPVEGRPVSHIAAGEAHTCAIVQGGSPPVVCWGNMDDGRLGDTSAEVVFSNPAELALGRDFSCLRSAGGEVHCWGGNRFGSLGRMGPGGAAPRRVTPLPSATALAAGQDHVCADTVDGVHCWGYGGAGQLGRGQTFVTPEPTVVAIPGGGRVLAVGAGDRSTCAVVATAVPTVGELFCWGEGRRGRVGAAVNMDVIGSTATPILLGAPPTPLGNSETRLELAYAGRGLVEPDDAWAWGHSAAGRLGLGAIEHIAAPRMYSGADRSVNALALGEHHGCLIHGDNSLWCFGRSEVGELGKSIPVLLSSGPLPVAKGMLFATVDVGRRHSCALTRDGALYCWGDNRLGQSALRLAARALVPTVVFPAQMPPATPLLLATGGAHTCVADGALLRCAGDNHRGQLGQGAGAPTRSGELLAVSLPNADQIVHLAAGEATTCVHYIHNRPRHQVACWGANDHGQIGNGGLADERLPASVTLPMPDLPFLSLAAGYDHACVVTGQASDNLLCWGSDADGALGTRRDLFFATPAPVAIP